MEKIRAEVPEGNGWLHLYLWLMEHQPERFTCYHCGNRHCPYYNDPYNLDGDCLMEK